MRDYCEEKKKVTDEIKQQVFAQNGLDNGLILDFIRAMNIARRNLVAYPRRHILVIESFQKVLNILHEYFKHSNHLALGVAKDILMWGTKALDRKNIVFQGFSRILFGHGIVSLTLLRGLTAGELMEFDYIISQTRNEVYRQGGVAVLLSRAKVRNIKVQLIDYGMFQAQDGLAPSREDNDDVSGYRFWQNFVKGLFGGTLDCELEPEALAAIVNSKYLDLVSNSDDGCDAGSCLNVTFDFGPLLFENDAVARLTKFMKSLSEELRKVFIDKFLNSLTDHMEVADDVLASLPYEIILDALEYHTNKEIYIPPIIFEILQTIKSASNNTSNEGMEELLKAYSKEELADKFRVIFKEDEFDKFVPLDYQKALEEVRNVDRSLSSEFSQIQQVEEAFNNQCITIHFARVLAHMISNYTNHAMPDSLLHSLKDQCCNLIRDGEFHIVSDIYESLRVSMGTSANNSNIPNNNVLKIFSEKDFVHEVLDTSGTWGKENLFYITELIKKIGHPFVEPLLDRLAEEQNRELRHYFLELLPGLGDAVRDSAIRRLNDHRWYVIRNLVIVLHNLNDPSVAGSLHSILEHPHPRVRDEVLRTLIKFNDPSAKRILLHEMESNDSRRCLKAINLAGMTRHREASPKLLEFLNLRGLDKHTFSLKKASVYALAEIGDPSVLPFVEAALKKRSFLFRQKARLLKTLIIDSLAMYPAPQAALILQNIATKGPRGLAEQASGVMNKLKGYSP
jgi:hypothetical protein